MVRPAGVLRCMRVFSQSSFLEDFGAAASTDVNARPQLPRGTPQSPPQPGRPKSLESLCQLETTILHSTYDTSCHKA